MCLTYLFNCRPGPSNYIMEYKKFVFKKICWSNHKNDHPPLKGATFISYLSSMPCLTFSASFLLVLIMSLCYLHIFHNFLSFSASINDYVYYSMLCKLFSLHYYASLLLFLSPSRYFTHSLSFPFCLPSLLSLTSILSLSSIVYLFSWLHSP